ncbi:DUF790 family protein [Zavarzinella formosa]|uniref:DUF790 family protein n=1 Tax=Zavarzinella formosa TaxID=360055 RepID=UPI00031DF87A|nr:DUF790 family protein [Zavarzinella formosa]
MLTGKHVRVRMVRNRLIPQYLDVMDPVWQETATTLLELFRTFPGRSREEIEQELAEVVGDLPSQLVQQGLAKLLEDRCEFEVDSEQDPASVREQVFLEAARQRTSGRPFDRQAILEAVGLHLSTTPELVDLAIFADLKAEQRVTKFADITPLQLIHRYNVALAQAALLRSSRVVVRIEGESQARYRHLFRAIKFHRLIGTITHAGRDAYEITLDGPLSLFSSTQKYGVQLAIFLPTLLLCKRFSLAAEVKWGPQRKEKEFRLDSSDGLRSHLVDYGDHTPPEITMFAESFAKLSTDWTLSADAQVMALGNHFWVPDFTLIHAKSGQVIYVELLGFWRKTDAEAHYVRLQSHYPNQFILGISDQFNLDEETAAVNANIYRFRRTPLPSEVVRIADALGR